MLRGMSVMLTVMFLVTAVLGVFVLGPGQASAAEFSTKIFRAAAVGAAVTAVSPQLNKFVNTITFNNKIPYGTTTKIVPILSVGEKGYIGAAQVAGPAAYVNQVKVVWAYDDNFSNNEFRLRILVPSNSHNPLQLEKVQKVGITAVIDVALDGKYKNETYSRSISTGNVIKAGAVAVAINAAADPINRAINTVTRGLDSNTRVVPMISVGEKAYIGGVQVSGSGSLLRNVKAALQYEAAFDTGKYRVKAIVPISSVNPLKTGRVQGVGITALIDTSIADQERVRQRERYWRTNRTAYRPMDSILKDRFRGDITDSPRHDNGLHKGWYIGKGNQRKAMSGIWLTRYNSLPPSKQPEFRSWWREHQNDKPDELEKKWHEWNRQNSKPASVRSSGDNKSKWKKEDKRENNGNGRGKRKK